MRTCYTSVSYSLPRFYLWGKLPDERLTLMSPTSMVFRVAIAPILISAPILVAAS